MARYGQRRFIIDGEIQCLHWFRCLTHKNITGVILIFGFGLLIVYYVCCYRYDVTYWWARTPSKVDSAFGESIHELDSQYFLVVRDNITRPFFYKTLKNHRNDKFKEKNNSILITPRQIRNRPGIKRILIYNLPSWWGKTWCESGITTCPVSCQCDHGTEYINQSDGVIIDGLHLKDPVPPIKKKDQVWIFFGLEPPAHYYTSAYKSYKWRRSFNWTMTYRLDSDVVTPYDVIIRHKQPANKDYALIAAQKTKHALLVASNCHTESRREVYAAELNKYYRVDIFGKCGAGGQRLKAKLANSDIQKQYRFYLAFENSFCDDYVTEKVFKIYNRDTNLIPIVRGGGNYTTMLPKGTYIDAADFRSPKDLGAYLKYLEQNVTAYNEILRKKDEYYHAGYPHVYLSAICDVCIKLNNLHLFSNYYTDVVRWLHEGVCRL